MQVLDRQARRLGVGASVLIVLATIGWMGGVAFGFYEAVADNLEFVSDTEAILIPAVQGVVTLALVAVALTLSQITKRVRIRAEVMSAVLPRLVTTAK